MSTYSALFSFLGAALSGLVLTNVFGEIAARGTQRGSRSKRSWVWAMRHCEFSAHNTGLSSSPTDRRYDLPDRGHHIRNLAAALVRLAGRVYLCQRRTLHRHGVRRAIPGPHRTTSVTRLTDVYNTHGYSLRPRDPFSGMDLKGIIV
ncbi:hypothetical protein V8E53_006942 [Lactarius tabidus]